MKLLNTSLAESKGFWYYYLNCSRDSIRYALGLAVILVGLFSILDLYLAPNSVREIWLIRFVVVILLSLAYKLTYSRYFTQYSQIILFLASVTVSGGVLAIIFVTKQGDLANKLYYCGLILCIGWSHGILRLKAQLALISTLLTIIEYNSIVLFSQSDLTQGIGIVVLLNNNFFLIGAGVIGVWGSNVTERMFQKDFENQEAIAREKEQLHRAQKNLLEQDAMKGKLISIISHDIRGPVSSFKSLLQLFVSGSISAEVMKDHSSELDDSFNEVINMLNSMLSWSVMQLGDNTLQKSNIKAHELTNDVLSLLRLLAIEKSIQLINNCNRETEIFCEASMIKLVLRNLVSNAIKFTERGQIEVDVNEFRTHIQISVKDNGGGMPLHVAENLFNWKTRHVTPGTRSEKGAGIGLLVCKEFVEKHGGSIYFRTIWGEGTTFHFDLPKEI